MAAPLPFPYGGFTLAKAIVTRLSKSGVSSKNRIMIQDFRLGRNLGGPQRGHMSDSPTRGAGKAEPQWGQVMGVVFMADQCMPEMATRHPTKNKPR